MDADVEKLITGWFERARDNQLTHDDCGTRLNRWHYRLGIPIIILTTGAAAAIFYWLGRPQQLSDPIKMGIGIAAAIAALLACLQTFLGLSQRADQHKMARDRYGALRRSLQILKTFSPSEPAELQRSITDIQRQMDRLAETSPAVPARWKKKIDKRLDRQREERVSHLLRLAHEEEERTRARGPRANVTEAAIAGPSAEDANDEKVDQHVAA
jgi:hypothetical protein